MKPVVTKIDSRYSAPDAKAPVWEEIEQVLRNAEVYAFTSILPGGDPHTVPLAGLWNESGFWFCTGLEEQKVKNLQHTPRGSVHIGSTSFMKGMDVVVRGAIKLVTSEESLGNFADESRSKYPEFFRFTLVDGRLLNPHDLPVHVYNLVPESVHVFTRAENTVQAKYTFS